jgi:predicted NAD/FAD-binding protein
MRVAVIGAGISGLGAAFGLNGRADVVLYEKDARLGGHAHTRVIDYDDAPMAVDVGFIVFNAHNYPNLVGLFDHLGVQTHESDMSFAVSDPDGFEWSSNGLGGIFAWKRNLARPTFLAMLADIVRFSTKARADLDNPHLASQTIEQYCQGLKLGAGFLKHYLLPMGAAIWSTPEREMLDYPAQSFLRFFDNHRLLHAKRPKWRTVSGGSHVYVDALRKALRADVRQGDAVVKVDRDAQGATLTTAAGHQDRFDHVVFACHSDEALAILGDRATPQERTALSAVRYGANVGYLHRDPALMPSRRNAWASWNYLRRAGMAEGTVAVTYWMNVLQGLDPARPVFVTLNPPTAPKADLTFASLTYSHPQFDRPALAAQKALKANQGQNRTYFAGAWLGYGFHEDGLRAGLEVALALGGGAPWLAAPSPSPTALAA